MDYKQLDNNLTVSGQLTVDDLTALAERATADVRRSS